MDYITFRDFSGMAIGGEVSLSRGDTLTLNGRTLYYEGIPICFPHSENCKKHFSRNDDGNGLERGDITYAIAYGDRDRVWTEEVNRTDPVTGEETIETVERHGRFTPEEISMIERDYPQFDRDPAGVLLFTDEFFTADIETLRELASRLEIEV